MTKRNYRPNADKYYQERLNGKSPTDIADKYGVAYSTVTAGISEYKKTLYAPSGKATPLYPHIDPNPVEISSVPQRTKPLVVRTLTYKDSNAGTFWKRYKDLKSRKRWLRIFFPFDKHLPFHDTDAVALDNVIIRDIGADIIVHGSDIFDFPKISRHELDYELAMNPEWDDTFHRVEQLYIDDTDTLTESAPDALKPFIFGNHCIRFVEMALRSPMPRSLLKMFVKFIKNNDTVFYMGRTQELLLDTLFIRHNGGAGQNVAKGMASKDMTVHHVAGHTHRPDSYTNVGTRFTSNSMVVGCRCELIPTYFTEKGQHSGNWAQSLGMAVLDTETGNVELTNMMYYRDEDSVYAMLGGTVYSVPRRFKGIL